MSPRTDEFAHSAKARRLPLRGGREEFAVARQGDDLHLTLFARGREGVCRPRRAFAVSLAALVQAIGEVTDTGAHEEATGVRTPAWPSHPPQRVPTGRIDEQVTVGVDRTVAPPLLMLALSRRCASEVRDDAFKLVHTITLQTQYATLLVERIEAALAGERSTHPSLGASDHGTWNPHRAAPED